MMRAFELAHTIVQRCVESGDAVVDATVGNGFDTHFLAELVGPDGFVYGFDVQESALTQAAKRVHGMPQVTLFGCGHECLVERLPDTARSQLTAVMFNLGYLPGSDKSIVTKAETTLSGLQQALGCLKPGGLVTLVLYPGHPRGACEADAVRTFAAGLSEAFRVAQYARINSLHAAPELLVIERRR